MAFDKTRLELLAGGGATLSLYAYRTAADTKAEVDAAGYFNAAAPVLRAGDFMFVAAADGFGVAVVNASAAGAVDLADMLAVGAADVR